MTTPGSDSWADHTSGHVATTLSIHSAFGEGWVGVADSSTVATGTRSGESVLHFSPTWGQQRSNDSSVLVRLCAHVCSHNPNQTKPKLTNLIFHLAWTKHHTQIWWNVLRGKKNYCYAISYNRCNVYVQWRNVCSVVNRLYTQKVNDLGAEREGTESAYILYKVMCTAVIWTVGVERVARSVLICPVTLLQSHTQIYTSEAIKCITDNI